MITRILSGAPHGVAIEPVEVEVEVAAGLPATYIVGLADAGVQEARERIRSALHASGSSFPRTRITINLAPADTIKRGTRFDVPIAIALAAQTDERIARTLDTERVLAFGELALDGRLRKTPGLLAAGRLADDVKASAVVVPKENAQEVARFSRVPVYACSTLYDVLQHVAHVHTVPRARSIKQRISATLPDVDFADIHGQEYAKRALLIAAAGGHNLRMEGPPGSGKTLLSRALAGILPALAAEEQFIVSQIYSVMGLLDNKHPFITERPFRSPHHSATAAALLGGGRPVRPGELTLAHHGVLFLDEFPEFDRRILEALRQPLEDGRIVLARAERTECYPASFILVAAHNPCPCGYRGDPVAACVCSPGLLARYQQRLSGPILDRIDLHVQVPRLSYEKLRGEREEKETTAALRIFVQQARDRQSARYKGEVWKTNSSVPHHAAARYFPLPDDAEDLLRIAMQHHQLSARAVGRTIKVSRTIADLAGAETIAAPHIAEALQFRGAAA